jgi:predicted DCC family thiol-disulfide oxidoreductase YuxK
MVRPPAQSSSGSERTHLVLYDGICALCNRVVQFVLTHDRRGVFRFASLQSATGRAVVERYGGDPLEVTSLYVVTDYRTSDARAFTRSQAALIIASQLGWPWKAMRVVGVLPTALLDRVYDVVARTRYRVFGRYEQCPIPTPEFRSRFVD